MTAGKRTAGERELERLIALFLRAETDIINEIGRLRSLGLADYHKAAALRRVQDILRSLSNDCWVYVPKMIELEFYAGHPGLRSIAETAAKHLAAYQSAAALTALQTELAGRLAMNLMGQIEEACATSCANLGNILLGRREPDIFRKAGLARSALAEAEGVGSYRALPGFVEALRREGVTAFVDRAGRRWSLHSYGSMALRTTRRQAQVLAVLTADEGQDLYRISSHDSGCPVCAPLEGRVYSRSGSDPDFPPLAAAFGKIDPQGPDTLENSWLNIHPNCLHSIAPWTAAGRSREELEQIKRFSSFRTNPLSRDPRTAKQVEVYRRKELARANRLRSRRQWERYREALGDRVPSFQTFLRHKQKDDETYRSWMREYRWEMKSGQMQSLVGLQTANGITVNGMSSHFVDQAIQRGFTAEGVSDALLAPLRVKPVKMGEKGLSQQFIGSRAAVAINPETGNLITGWRK